MPQIIIANIIDFLASMVQIYSGTVKEKGKILVLQILQLGMQTISMILLGAIPGAISNVLSCIRNYLCYKNVFTWPIKIALIVISLVLTVPFNNQGLLGYLPFVVCTIYVLFMDIKDPIKFKLLVTLTFVPWVFYFFIIKSYTGAFFAATTVVTSTWTLIQMMRGEKKRGIKRVEVFMGMEQLHSGEIYYPTDDSIMEVQLKCLDKLYDFNATRPSEMDKRMELLKEMLAEVGEECYIEPPFHSNWGGKHVHFGRNVYANFGLTCVDDTHIYVGDYTMLGPNVVLATAGHPICPELREKVYQYNMPIHIGRNCWLGAGVIVMPGVTIGDNTVIGAGSVVTKDIPGGVVAVGNPCKVLREINEHDYEYYYKDKKIPEEMKVK